MAGPLHLLRLSSPYLSHRDAVFQSLTAAAVR